MNVPNVAPNMPHVIPGMPNAAPSSPPGMMQSQQAGQVQLGCPSCAGVGTSSNFWARVPLWAKIAIPMGLITTVIITAVALTNRRRVMPYESLVEEDEEIDY